MLIQKLIASFVALVVFTSSAFAACDCVPSGTGIPASALLPSVDYGQQIKVAVVQPKAMVKTAAKTTKTVSPPAKDEMVDCLTGTSANSIEIVWAMEDTGACPGKILYKDAVRLAAKAAAGAVEFRTPFYIPSKCDSGWAKVPTKVEDGKIKLYPWRKTCVSGYFVTYVVK
ncbi:hypothetical protein [Agrobacterium sp. T29]|uniref:hypothetical protein n=1 Tax=Agrobacterium sp. T29 TaxID=2580515 RepID=UPI00115ED4C1|nr:hypothetical protein [Agrobacterium sp. T29]